MYSIAFVDTEIDPKSLMILDMGGVKNNDHSFHSNSLSDFTDFLSGVYFICGHNILNHDIKYIQKAVTDAEVDPANIIDTLYLSPLLFPARPYHALLKDDKLQTEDTNNPLNDSRKAKDLFFEEVSAFNQLEDSLRQIFYLLLNEEKEFHAFFKFMGYKCLGHDLESIIQKKFHIEICEKADLTKIISAHPIGLAYCLALINCRNRYSITPHWVLKNFPEVDLVMRLLRGRPCISGCVYCDQALDIHKGLKRHFGFDDFRTYAGEPLQEKAAKAAIDNKCVLAIFPTGGGKSITFQLPALMGGEAEKGLTVVISPLQSLMKDQVDNLEKIGITEAVTINGLLDPIERAKSFERVEDGSVSILYISPESLRSITVERLMLGRKIIRIVIDEAHCFSSWGQDFRVDYLYIGDFIKSLQEKKNLAEPIPVSCFTATAKQKVIEDICTYFKEKLSLELEVFRSGAARTNLRYKVFEKGNEEEKYNTIRDLIEEKRCPTIIYVSRTRKAYKLAERLTEEGFSARAYHGKMEVKEKTANQTDFIDGAVQVMVATSAFGMGVDKKDVGMVVHYDISDSLENYIQEAGRAGRDENISAECFVLFNEEDLSKHFILLNQTKLSIKEIQQVWKAVKEITRYRQKVSNSALEIARKAGWDDTIAEIETRVKTAIAALEEAGYLKRGQNMPRVFANSIVSKTAQEAIDKINVSTKFDEKEKEKAVRIIRKLFSSKSKKQAGDETAEARVDYIADHLGIIKDDVIKILYLLRDEKILADAKDLTAFIKKGGHKNRSLAIVETFARIENCLLKYFEEQEKTFHIKQLNEEVGQKCRDVAPQKLKTIINFWAIKNWIKRYHEPSKNHVTVLCEQSKAVIKEKLEKRHALARFVVEYLYDRSNINLGEGKHESDEVLVEFSVLQLKEAYENRLQLFEMYISIEDIEDTLFYLSRIDAIKLEGGFMVLYNRLTIERLEHNNRKRYKEEDYEKLKHFYENKIQQIHIVGEYARKMIEDYQEALQFVDDYFQLNYASFLHRYFPGSRQDEIKKSITPAKFRQLFGTLSPSQAKVIYDDRQYMAVTAGPGSGKTRVLVHKLASLMMIEDVKHEQLLMLTFSRAAATEFRQRLQALIGNAAYYIEIKTFHAYCFDLLGKVGSLEKSDAILKDTIDKIAQGEVEANQLTKTVLVIDEAQDMNADEFALINALMKHNEDMRLIAVGDDDQNIYEFRGASSKYLAQFIREKNAAKHELIENFRSKNNLVEFTNQFVKRIRHRLKETPIIAYDIGNGDIKLVRYQCGNLIVPLVNDILTTGLSGTTCVLTKTNEEALQITGLLLNNRMQAKLIQSNDGFSLYQLDEVRYFMNQLKLGEGIYRIADEVWANAQHELSNSFGQSAKLELCKNLIKAFEAANPKVKYKSDLEVFIAESRLEDFYNEEGETIFVSTIHKAKGKEFNNVFLMLENFSPDTDEAKRLLYVAMTRAKQNLTIHLNGNYLDHITIDNLKRTDDEQTYLPPGKLAMHLTFKDVWLDYFISKQHLISSLASGDELKINGDQCTNFEGQSLLKFSKHFLNTIEAHQQGGYQMKEAKVNFILYWKKEGAEQEIKIILPEVYFERD